jgi:hypothetical protein
MPSSRVRQNFARVRDGLRGQDKPGSGEQLNWNRFRNWAGWSPACSETLETANLAVEERRVM